MLFEVGLQQYARDRLEGRLTWTLPELANWDDQDSPPAMPGGTYVASFLRGDTT